MCSIRPTGRLSIAFSPRCKRSLDTVTLCWVSPERFSCGCTEHVLRLPVSPETASPKRRWDPVRLAVVALSQPHAGKLFAQHRNGEGPLRNLLRIAQDSLTAGGHSVCFRVYLRVVPGLYLAADVPVRQVPSRPGACRVRSQRVSSDRDSFGFVDRIGPGGSILPPDSGLAVLDSRRGVILCDSLHRPDWREPGARVHA